MMLQVDMLNLGLGCFPVETFMLALILEINIMYQNIMKPMQIHTFIF